MLIKPRTYMIIYSQSIFKNHAKEKKKKFVVKIDNNMEKLRLSLSFMILLFIFHSKFDGANAAKLNSDKLCSQCSNCESKQCPASEAYPHMTAFDNTLIAGALQSDFVDSYDRAVYSVPDIKGGESEEYNAYFGWKSTSGSASGYHR